MTKPTGKVNPVYRLTPLERLHVGMLAAMNLWPKQHIADAYHVTPKTVRVCLRRYQEMA